MSTYLIATDLSPSSRKAARAAALLAKRTHADLDYFCALPVDVAGKYRIDPAHVRELLDALAARDKDSAAAASTTAHVAVVSDVPEAILSRARDSRASLVVVAPHGVTSWKRILLGSVALKVLRGAETSVMVARAASETAKGPVLAGVDLGPTAAVTLRHAVAVARAVGADLDVVHVIPPVEFLLPMVGPIATAPPKTAAPARELARRVAQIPHRGVRISTRVVVGSPAEMLVGEARRSDARLVVVGSSTKSRLRAAFLGSVAQAVAAACTVSVLVVRGPAARGR